MDGPYLPALSPAHFFELSAELLYCSVDEPLGEEHLLPDCSEINGSDAAVDILMGWNHEELRIAVRGSRPFQEASPARLDRSDALEFFIDTRDIKDAGFNTRFCHHFYFLPKAEDGSQAAAEITRFRTEDSHPLCDPSELRVERHSKEFVELRVPAKSLVGYDPELFPRLGFTYRFNRENGSPQYFGCTEEAYRFDQLPALWSRLRLVDENGSLR